MKYLKKIFLLLSICVLMTSCMSAVFESKLTVEKGAIPIDFKDYNATLLCVTYDGSYGNYLKKYLKKYYSGKYKIITKDDLTNEKYKDENKFRYVFDYSKKSAGYKFDVNAMDRSREYLYKVRKFYVYDRIEKKTYSSRITSSFWAKILKTYLNNLNTELVK
ncbi:hypothetical protein [Aureivirga marina]|uniref:hypothetical protein n=1 Tax=Aureivirga marina TaxID=1182451 RepID=UPI0018C92ACA|nr:hypothetical protein [Aureivirga marina]